MKTAILALLLVTQFATANCVVAPGQYRGRGEVGTVSITTCENGQTTIVYTNGTVRVINSDGKVITSRVSDPK